MVIGRYLSCTTSIVIHLLQLTDDCGPHPSKLRLVRPGGKAILVLGIPTGIQNANSFAIANLCAVRRQFLDAVMVSGMQPANAITLIFNIMAAFYTGCSQPLYRTELGRWATVERMKKELSRRPTYSAAGAIFGGLLLIFDDSFSRYRCDGACFRNRCRNAA